MATEHIGSRLQAYLGGALAAGEREQAATHLAGCTACSEELALLREARAVLPPLRDVEPRQGFAAMVALNARDVHAVGRPWWRWAAGGLAAAGLAAAALFAVMPRGAERPDEMVLAQRLDLYEDMTVMQNQEALDDLEVVTVLHQLEATP